MEYLYIKKHLGEKWLQEQIELGERKINSKVVYKILGKIDELISKLENIKGFDKWAMEAKESQSFEDCLFEIMIFENLYKKADFMEIKPKNFEKIPEAEVKLPTTRCLPEGKSSLRFGVGHLHALNSNSLSCSPFLP